MQNLEALAAAVKAEMERQKLNTYEVADRARKKGYKVVHGTVWNVINGNVKEVKDKTIVAIANGLNLPEQTLFAVVRGKVSGAETLFNERFIRLAEKYALLPDEEKTKIDPFLSAFDETIDRMMPVEPKEKKINGNKNLLNKFFDEESEFNQYNNSDVEETKKPSRKKAS